MWTALGGESLLIEGAILFLDLKQLLWFKQSIYIEKAKPQVIGRRKAYRSIVDVESQ